MLRTLYSRMALTLFVLLLLVGLVLIHMIKHSSTLYQQEVSQKLNADLAGHIVAEQPLMIDGRVNEAILDDLFHDLMVINPSIELYILDNSGRILGYFAPEGKVKLERVALRPILTYISGDARYPLKGDDPRNPEQHKVFSAAEIRDGAGLQGYLYIVLGGEHYDDIVAMLGNSFILDSTLLVLLAALSVALLGGMFAFALLTRRLRLLGNVMRHYGNGNRNSNSDISACFSVDQSANDEIAELGRQFNTMAQKIDQQIKELQQMDSMRRDMVANVSHDLRTPLTTMRGYLETLLLKSDELSVDEQKQYLETALSHSEHLARLVEELFELARLDSCETVVYSEPFSMCELVQDVAQKYRLLAEERAVRLETHLNPDAPLVYGDIAMMQRVLENLLDNGLRHTPAGGSISISVDIDSGNVVVKVADTGKGIPSEVVPRIFERFYQQDTTRENYANAGLGLAIVQRILELHNSVIKVNSELEHGTTFTFQMTSSPTA
ncbi:MAG: ATP-binding protein [Gammaproteobacteria bacterium]|jgi:signal transduction histidine kinase